MRAHCTDDGRIIFWTYDDDADPEVFETYFSNGDYIDRPEFNHYEPGDWVIKDGIAYENLTSVTEITKLEKELEDDDYIASKFVRALVTCDNITDILGVIINFRQEYGARFAANNEKAARINELEN